MDDAYHLVRAIEKNGQEALNVALSEFRGHPFLDLRIFADLGDGTPRPTKKGVTLRLDRLGDLIEALQEVEAEAERRGLIGGRG